MHVEDSVRTKTKVQDETGAVVNPATKEILEERLPQGPNDFLRIDDVYTTGEVLEDQPGANDVLTFTFSAPVDIVWVRCEGGDVRVDPFGGDPTSTKGIKVEDKVPTPMPVRRTTVKVWAPSGTTVNVWGFRA